MLSLTRNRESGATVRYSTRWRDDVDKQLQCGRRVRNTVKVRQTDVAGNTVRVGTLTFTRWIRQRRRLGVALGDTGTSNSDGITSSGVLSLAEVRSGATVQYSTDVAGRRGPASVRPKGRTRVKVRQTDVAGTRVRWGR